MASALDTKIAQVAGTRLCRFCSQAVPAGAVICACRIARGEVPHTEWTRDLKRWLCVRAIERRQLSHMSEHDLWCGLAVTEFVGRWIGEGRERTLVHMSATITDVFPLAVAASERWVASGLPSSFHI